MFRTALLHTALTEYISKLNSNSVVKLLPGKCTEGDAEFCFQHLLRFGRWPGPSPLCRIASVSVKWKLLIPHERDVEVESGHGAAFGCWLVEGGACSDGQSSDRAL